MEASVKEVYNLRRNGHLEEAYRLAWSLFQKDKRNDDYNGALAWVAIDLCKQCLENHQTDKAQEYLHILQQLSFTKEDEFTENIHTQISRLIERLDCPEVQRAKELSKAGNYQEAVRIFQNLEAQKKLPAFAYEAYGWAIYRYLQNEAQNLPNKEVKKLLKNYLDWMVPRPSKLHSCILSFAISHFKNHSNEFDIFNFFLLWGPEHLREEDLQPDEQKNYPSLISRVARELVNSKRDFDFDKILEKIQIGREAVIEAFREAYHWHLYHIHKNQQFSELWHSFEEYNEKFAKYGPSEWHSKILERAVFTMKDGENEYRFVRFFKNWGPNNLRAEDWKHVQKNEETYEPIAKKAIKKAYEAIKKQPKHQDLSWLIDLHEEATKRFPDDEWLLRQKAQLYYQNNDLKSAEKLYKQLVLMLPDKYYVWYEFSQIVNDDHLKIGMLSKALSTAEKEDFIGDVRLELAEILIKQNLLEQAYIELAKYKQHRNDKNWRLEPGYETLFSKVRAVQTDKKDNQALYQEYIPVAESFVYADLPWTEAILVREYQNDKGKKRLVFTDGKIEFQIRRDRFKVLSSAELKQVFRFKLYQSPTEEQVVPLMVEPVEKATREILREVYAYVHYVNEEKNIVHAITPDNQEVYFPQSQNQFTKGDFITAKSYVHHEKLKLIEVQKVDKHAVLSKFRSAVAVIEGINEPKQLMHFVISTDLRGRLRYQDTELRPAQGEFIKIWFVVSKDKHNDKVAVPLEVQSTDEVNSNLYKEVTGSLQLMFREGYSYDGDVSQGKPSPTHAFIDDEYYVPQYWLEKCGIEVDCQVKARLIYHPKEKKWKILTLQKL